MLRELKKVKPHFVFLQETHFKTDRIPKWHVREFPSMFHATNSLAKTKGASILIAKHISLEITDTLIDKDGRYVFVKGSLWNTPLTLANIYAPNTAQVSFFREMSTILTSFQEGCLLLGGDFNLAINPIVDTSTGASSMPYKALKQVKKQLQDLSLHDTWRLLNPSGRDYSFFSTPHNRYSRLDYLFITQKDIHLLKSDYRTDVYLRSLCYLCHTCDPSN